MSAAFGRSTWTDSSGLPTFIDHETPWWDGSQLYGASLDAQKAVRSGTVTGVATPVRLGSTVVTYEVAITDERGGRVCTARLTCLLLR